MKKCMHYVMLFLFLAVAGCKDTHEKAKDFVDDYNALAPKMASQSLQSTIAELQPDNTIHIIMVSNVLQNEETKGAIRQALPTIMAEVLGRVSTFNELVAEGVKFKVEYRASDNSVLASTILDAAAVKVLKSKNGDKATAKYSTSNPKAQEMLALVNKTLPITDKKAGTTITKIDIIGEDLVYFVEVDNELKEALKDPEAVAIMKTEISHNPQIMGFLQSGKGYGIRKVRIKYLGSDDKTVAEVLLDKDDMR
ncbi:hypothetical protein [Flavobacterium pallidum]|uniref:Uncharacterized protein n=1 Tax=Flavobacterium pallidum TaxID=2172098 RepID=A0A2S1SGN6_9FLAO|nr:hypothetical protein [Flavobacterium pallidum]AWI25545.1 hypothetical protein HYN49_06350 [Flavobacterium pallidum]